MSIVKTKTVQADFGREKIEIEVPENSAVIEFQDPEFLSDPVRSTVDALTKPVGSPPLADLVKPGMTVAIGFDDPTRPPLPWQTILPSVIAVLIRNGVKEKDISLICANGAHRKWFPNELKRFLGDKLFDRFWISRQIINHDCQNPVELTYLGTTERGGYVEHNRRFIEG